MMIYIKTKVSDNVEMKINLYDDEIYTQCAKCEKEIQIEKEELKQILENGDLASTSLFCEKCSKINNRDLIQK